MPGRRWTVLVVPQGSGVSKEIEISSGVLKSIITFGSVLGVMAVASVYIAITWAVDISRVGRLERRNTVIETELYDMQGILAHLTDSMSIIAERDLEVRLLAGLQPNDPDVQQAGVGGPALLDASGRLLSETEMGQQTVSMRENLETLIRRARLLSGSFQQAVDTMTSHKERLDRTPSIMPTPGFLSSGFSTSRMHPIFNVARAHQGIDVVSPRGTPIVAPAAGRVVDVGNQTGYGKIVTVDHGNGIRTRYAHCDEIMVKAGQRVARGEIVATVGRTGIATNYHLHYEVLVNGRHIDPRTFIFGEIIVD
jgi:hypothetical protein